MGINNKVLYSIIAVAFVGGLFTAAYAGPILPMITLGGDVTITGDMICPGCVDSAEIADGTITQADLGFNSVGALQIQSNAVGDGELAENSVGFFEIQKDAVRKDEIASNSVGSDELRTNSVNKAKITANGVGLSEIDITITTYDADTSFVTTIPATVDMIPVDGKSFCALLKVEDKTTSLGQCDIDFGGLSNWQLQARNGVVCQAICIQFG